MTNEKFHNTKKLIKGLLKSEYPELKFRFKKTNYDTLNIYVSDDTKRDEIRSLVSQFEGKYFEGMIDLEIFLPEHDIYGVGYIFVKNLR